MLDEIKVLLDIDYNEQDKLINILIKQAKSRILAYINQSDYLTTVIPDDFDYIIVDLTMKMFNKNQNNGVTSSSEGDFKNEWEKDFLSEHLSVLNAYRNKKLKEQNFNESHFKFY